MSAQNRPKSIRDKPVLVTTLVCGAAGVLGHAVLWMGAGLGWDDDKVFWQPVVGMALVAVSVTAFGGFYMASERARIAIAASFLLTFLVTLTYIVTIRAFAEAAAEGIAGDLFVDFRTVVITVVGFYFGSEAIISVAKIWRTPDAQRGDTPTDADRDLVR